MATTGATVAAAMVARARREVREHFENQNAFDPGHAVAYDAPDRMHERQFEMFVGRGILRDRGDGRYWIDREALRLEEERHKEAMKLVLKMILLVAVVAIAVAAVVAWWSQP